MHASDGMDMIRSQLCRAVMRLDSESKHMSDAAVARRMREIERIADEYHLSPLARLARSGAHAVGGSGPRHALACHMERMQDALDAPSPGEEATSAILASIAMRLR